MKKYIIVSHVLFTSNGQDNHGPAHDIYDFLKKKKQNVYFLKHDITGNIRHKENYKGEEIFTKTSGKDLIIKTIREIVKTLQFIKTHTQKKKSSDTIIYIGIDPVNAFAGALAKILHILDKNIYFNADYADKRFINPFINTIYKIVDKIAISFADEVWAVSTRIIKRRIEQGVKQEKNKLLPNSPFFDSIKQKAYNGNKDLVIIAYLGERLQLEPILQALKMVSQSYQDIRLQIVGSGPCEDIFKKLVKKLNLESQVIFLGQKQHNEAIAILTRSFIGFAIYEANVQNIYGDSMKAREYVACGLPVVINSVPATADDIREYNAGLVIDQIDSKEIRFFIERCIEDQSYYKELRKNALAMGRKFDKKRILEDLLG